MSGSGPVLPSRMAALPIRPPRAASSPIPIHRVIAAPVSLARMAAAVGPSRSMMTVTVQYPRMVGTSGPPRHMGASAPVQPLPVAVLSFGPLRRGATPGPSRAMAPGPVQPTRILMTGTVPVLRKPSSINPIRVPLKAPVVVPTQAQPPAPSKPVVAEDKGPVPAEECMICVEDLDATDQSINICPCSFKVCKLCFDKLAIDAETNVQCPGCRRPYNLAQITPRLKDSWIWLKTQMGSTKIGRLSFLLTQMLAFFKKGSVIPEEFFMSPVSLGLMEVTRVQDMKSALVRLRKFKILSRGGFQVLDDFYANVQKSSNLQEVFKRSCDLFCVHLTRNDATPEFKAQVMEHATLVLEAVMSWSNDDFLKDEILDMVDIVYGGGRRAQQYVPPPPSPAPPVPEGEDEQEHREFYRRLEETRAARARVGI